MFKGFIGILQQRQTYYHEWSFILCDLKGPAYIVQGIIYLFIIITNIG